MGALCAPRGGGGGGGLPACQLTPLSQPASPQSFVIGHFILMIFMRAPTGARALRYGAHRLHVLKLSSLILSLSPSREITLECVRAAILFFTLLLREWLALIYIPTPSFRCYDFVIAIVQAWYRDNDVFGMLLFLVFPGVSAEGAIFFLFFKFYRHFNAATESFNGNFVNHRGILFAQEFYFLWWKFSPPTL